MKNNKKILSEMHAKNKYLSGIINENEYNKLLQQIAHDFKASQDYEKERDDLYLMERKKDKNWISDVKPKEGKMHKILGIPEGELISSHYTSGKKLADALLDKVDDKMKVMRMLAFAANANKKDDIFDKALKALERIDESSLMEGKMHKILGIPEDELISSHYTSGKKLADALLDKVDDKMKVMKMLASDAGKGKKEDIFDKALKALERIDESSLMEGKMHKILGIPEDELISSHYTSGKKLATALLDKVDDKMKVMKMLASDAGKSKKEDIFDKALKALERIDESYGIDEEFYLLEGKKDKKSKEGKMHKILGIPEGELISSHYTSGKKLADALMDRVKDKMKVMKMLASDADANKKDDIFNKALKALERIDESYRIDDEFFL